MNRNRCCYFFLQIEEDDAETRGRGDAERNASQLERPGPKSQGFQSSTESPNSLVSIQLGSQSPPELSPRLPISASPRLFREAFNQPEFDTMRLILVKAAGGVLQAVYGPAIFRDGDQIVLKLGANLIPLTQSGDIFSIGNLRGKVSILEEKDLAGNPYPKATLSLVAKSRDIFKLSVQLASKELNFTAAVVEAALINEESLLPFLRQVPGGNALKMQELGLGEFAVKGITKSVVGDHGTSYKLQLADGRAVWTRGNVTTLLESGWQPQPDKPLTLVVTRIEELGEDRYTVDCALRERLPSLPTATSNGNGRRIAPGEGKAVDVEVKATSVVNEPAGVSERTPLRVVSGRPENPELSDFDSIPF